MRNVLVTGGAGFIGSNFVRFLLARCEAVRVVNLDLLTYAGSLENLRDLPGSERHVFVHGDVRDRVLVDALLREHAVDTIVHFAAESHVDRSILGPEGFIQSNVVGTFTLLEAAREYWAGRSGGRIAPSAGGGADGEDGARFRFHHISTDEVYGSLEPDEAAWTERAPYAPSSPYAASKAASDHLVRAYGHTYGLPYTITNCSNNYGPYQFPEKLIPLMILNALEGEPIPIYGDGLQVRDWLHVEDHCDAILAVLRRGRPGGTYNVGGGNQMTNLSLVRSVCAILDELLPDSPWRPHASRITHVADRPGHDRRYALDCTRIEAELGWRPRHSPESGLRATVEWYLEHRDWVDAIRSRPEYRDWIERNYALRGGGA